MIKQQQNGFAIRSDRMFLYIGIAATVMGCVAAYHFVPMFFEPILSSIDVFGIAFLSLWLLVVLGGGILSFYRFSKKLIIDNNGVVYQSIFGKASYIWDEIEDWGVVYDGRARGGQNCYVVYFANGGQQDKNESKKALSRSALRAHILSDDYDCLTQTVIPFCRIKTAVSPFIAEDKFRWI